MRFLGLVHRTDAKRACAYDHPSSIGQIDAELREAKDWTVVDMQRDWKRIFPFEPAPAG